MTAPLDLDAERRRARVLAAPDLGVPASVHRYLFDDVPKLIDEIGRLRTALARIAEAHAKYVDAHGGTWGECNECGAGWPCPTYVWATTDRDPLSTWDPADDETSGCVEGGNRTTPEATPAPQADEPADWRPMTYAELLLDQRSHDMERTNDGIVHARSCWCAKAASPQADEPSAPDMSRLTPAEMDGMAAIGRVRNREAFVPWECCGGHGPMCAVGDCAHEACCGDCPEWKREGAS